MAITPVTLPATQELPYSLVRKTKVGHIAADARQLYDAAIQAVCYIACVAKVHPVSQ